MLLSLGTNKVIPLFTSKKRVSDEEPIELIEDYIEKGLDILIKAKNISGLPLLVMKMFSSLFHMRLLKVFDSSHTGKKRSNQNLSDGKKHE